MNERAILDALDEIKKDLAEIRILVSRRRLSPYGYKPIKKCKNLSRKLLGGFRDPEIRAVVLKLRREGRDYKGIAAYVREHYSPALWVSKSAIHRFVVDARSGRLREFGINGDLL